MEARPKVLYHLHRRYDWNDQRFRNRSADERRF